MRDTEDTLQAPLRLEALVSILETRVEHELTTPAGRKTALFAAKAMAERQESTEDGKSLARALEILADSHPEADVRWHAAMRLAALYERKLRDRNGAIAAWIRLLDSPIHDEALLALDVHYAALNRRESTEPAS